MKLCPTVAGLIAIFSGLGVAAPTWPSAVDELEDVMFLNAGYKSKGFGGHVTPCSLSEFGVGRQTAAEWLRIGFHDMATANVFFEPHGGIDASLAFELTNGENLGPGFVTTFQTYSALYNSRLSVSDLVALGVYASVRACGGPIVPIRGGRIDATAAGPMGVPQPQNPQGTFINQFLRMGFNTVDMIQMTACGHAIGGVHSAQFPEIVPAGTAPNDYALFDNTLEFDNNIATRYINGPNTDPLSVGPSVAATRNADTVVFTADKNVTIQAMTNPGIFNTVCSSILQRMIDTVAPTVTLSEPLAPYEVKPSGLQLTLLSGGSHIAFSGDIRVRTTTRSAASILSVQIVYKNRAGGVGGTITTTTVSGTATGFDDSFAFYGFSANIPATTSISSFTVVIAGTGGLTTTHNNNGAGFPIQDSVIALAPQSCLSGTNLTIVAAVRTGVTSAVSLDVTQKVARNGGVPVPALSKAAITMVKGATIGPYDIYSGTSIIASAVGTKYGVSSGTFADDFKDPASLGATCAPIGTVAPSSTSSSVVSTSQSATSSRVSSTTSSTAVPTPVHKAVVGKYSFQGCFTEGVGVRALAGPAFVDYANMTSELCASNCAAYQYWGIEYYGECFCGDELAASSTQAPLEECSFICPGNPNEYCGAGNRLELYRLTSAATSSRSSSSVRSTSSGSTIRSSSSISVSTRSTTAPTSTPTLAIKPRVGNYVRQGCYTEGTGVRALSGAQFNDYVSMTLELCASNCAGTAYFGVEYGGECYCGQTLDVTSVPAANQLDCSFVCPGDASEYCGAGDRLELYKLGSASSSSSSLVSSTSSIRVSSSTRLSTTSTRSSSSSRLSTTVSTSISTSVRSSSSSRISSSSRLSTSSSRLSTSSSARPSSSSSRLSTTTSRSSSRSSSSSTRLSTSTLRSSTSTRLSTSTLRSSSSTRLSSSISSSKSSSTIKPSTTNTSKSSSSTRASSISSSRSSTRQSSSKPTSSSIIPSSTSKPLTSTSTSASATSVPTLQIVPSAGGSNYLGCFTEGEGVRALGAASFPSDTNTVESCVAACAGYKYAGMEYGRECWCANEFGAGSVQVPNAECSMTCAGDVYAYCGAGNRLQVYQKAGTGPSSSSTGLVSSTSTMKPVSTTSKPASTLATSTAKPSSSSLSTSKPVSTSSKPASSTSTLPPPAQPTPAIKPTIGPYTYLGCQTEGTSIRALTGAFFFNETAMTLEMCASNCAGWKYWGVEYGVECYCGNEFQVGSVRVNNAECSFTCPGDGGEFCGAGNRLSSYGLTV
ncbi:hypothetical protein VTL71DRAFT_245 [Oculimacula yallundae]|uniref:Heme peroxidase n=1 Tax=Oculimacula yallundae TaxID=86028 RepID=A0ABR4D0F5_9HELO